MNFSKVPNTAFKYFIIKNSDDINYYEAILSYKYKYTESPEFNWKITNEKIKIGCICQPFQKYVVNFLNKNYSEQINACAKNSFGGWQVYMKNKGNKKLSIEIVPMNGEDVVYALGEESSITNPGLKAISISIKKH